jgi:hypothetical protein
MTWRVSAARAPYATFLPAPARDRRQPSAVHAAARLSRDRRAAGPSGPRTRSRPARVRSSSGIDSAAQLASQRVGGLARKQHRQRDTPIMKTLSSRDHVGGRCTRIAPAWSGGAHKEIRPPHGCTAQEGERRNQHARMRGRKKLGGRYRAARPEPACVARCA